MIFFVHMFLVFESYKIYEGGRLYSYHKSQLISIRESYVPPEPESDVLVVDRPAFVQRSKASKDYAALDFLPVIQMYTSKYTTALLVYSSLSLKAETRFKRGQGGTHKVTNKCTIPSNWRNFLRHNDSKTVYNFLADKVAQTFPPNMAIVTDEPAVLSTRETGLGDWINALTRKPHLCAHQICCRTW